jgi:translation initiation factor 1
MALDFTAVIRIEKSGRRGKTVTVIEKLPKAEHFLETLARRLKTRVGSGGTYRWNAFGGIVEIQGDKRPLIRRVLDEEGIRYKG